jgi:hypothetical protein
MQAITVPMNADRALQKLAVGSQTEVSLFPPPSASPPLPRDECTRIYVLREPSREMKDEILMVFLFVAHSHPFAFPSNPVHKNAIKIEIYVHSVSSSESFRRMG